MREVLEMSSQHLPRGPARTTLASALGVAFGLAALDAVAAPPVLNCDDAGAGSLRQAIIDAADPDTIDLTQLPCSTISLTTGFLVASQNSLKIVGPGRDQLTIDGSADVNQYNIFLHNGSGTFEVDGLTVTNGYFYLNDSKKYLGGGCIFSSGSVVLDDVRASNCTMKAGSQSNARGGAVYAAKDLTITNSIVSGNRAFGAGGGTVAAGGGLFANGTVTVAGSSISDNQAESGGGIYSSHNAQISYSTIAGNSANDGGGVMTECNLVLAHSTVSANHGVGSGGVYAGQRNCGGFQALISNSTIANNDSGQGGHAAIFAEVPLTISTSTIAFNRGSAQSGSALFQADVTIDLESSIIAENSPSDIGGTSAVVITGAKNLLGTSSISLPPDTIGGCPRLEPLADRGGPTFTLALRQSSPAIDAGANPLALPYDQRGPGHPRQVGNYVDIGAFERQPGPDDTVFHNGFNGNSGFCDA